MTFKEFQQNTKRTLPNLDKTYGIVSLIEDEQLKAEAKLPKHLLNTIHMGLGMVSEIEELITAIRSNDKTGIGEELTDMLWYIANDLNIHLSNKSITQEQYNKFAGLDLGKQPMATDGGYKTENEEGWLVAICFNISALSDPTKKLLAYKKPVDYTKYLKSLEYLLGAINNLALSKEVSLEEFMEKVITKLKLRYPDSFTEKNAINRNHAKEREILEKS